MLTKTRPEIIPLSKHIGAEIRGLDFSAPSSVETINDWVSRGTNGKIPTILDRIEPGARRPAEPGHS